MFDTIEETGFLEIRFSAELTNVDRAALLTDRFLTEGNLRGHAFYIHLVMRELLNNAVIHGCGRDERKSVRYRIEVQGPNIIMQVEDEGDGFDWRAAKEKEVKLHEDRGRGVRQRRSA